MIKIADISKSNLVEEAQKKYDDIDAREKRLSAKAHTLREKKSNGLAPEEHQAQIALVMAGDALPDIDAELRSTLLEWRVVSDAKEYQRRQIGLAKKQAGKDLCESLRPEHDKLQKQLGAAMTNVHTIWSELFRLKRGILNQGVGLNGLFDADPEDFLGVPTAGSSEYWNFMRDSARAGYCRELRNEWQ